MGKLGSGRVQCLGRHSWAWLVLATGMVWAGLALAQTQATTGMDRRVQPLLDAPAITQLPETAKRFALLIGVDEYQDANISRLFGAANDAKAMRKVLVERAGFPADQVVVLATGESAGLLPTRSNILLRLSNLLSVVPKDGLFLLQFSGHGTERDRKPFLLPSDARLSDSVRLQEQLAVSVDLIRSEIEAAGIAQVVVLLDACRNEPGGRANEDNPLTESYLASLRFARRNEGVKAFATLFATEKGQRAWENLDRKRGYFSAAVEEALGGAAANEAGEITLGSMLRFLEEQVPKRVAMDLGAAKRQLPYAQVEGYRAGELVLAMAPRNAARPPEEDLCGMAWSMVRESNRRTELQGFLDEFPDCRYATLARIRLRGLASEPDPKRDEKPEVQPEPGTEEATPTASAAVVTPPPSPQPGDPRPGQLMEPLDLGGGVRMEFVYIPAGTFWMGCSPEEYYCFAPTDGGPRRQVTIRNAYELASYEVTQAEWEAVTGNNPSEFKGLRRPVEQVSWLEVQEFLQKLNDRNDGYRYRLPTEAEWEYAARAGVESRRYADHEEIGWHRENSSGETQDVGGKAPNKWGLYDVLGNVWEWCEDWYEEAHDVNQPGQDPIGPASGKYRVVRGGCWSDSPEALRLSSRSRVEPFGRNSVFGFRCLRERR